MTGMTNPSANTTSNFSFATLSSSGYILEMVTGFSISLAVNILTTFTISANSYVASNPNTVYSFVVGNNAPLLNGYTLSISFPSDYTFINYNSIVCTVAGQILPCSRLNSTYSSSINTVIININTTIISIQQLIMLVQ